MYVYLVIEEFNHALLRLLTEDDLVAERQDVHAEPRAALRERWHIHRRGLRCRDELPVIVQKHLREREREREREGGREREREREGER